MSGLTDAQARRPGAVSLKSVAMPAQHGGWGFLFEPILAGLILAPSWAGFCLGLSGLFLFLLHQPLKTALKDRLRGRRFARTGLAERVALVYAAGAAAAFLTAHLIADHAFGLPLLIAVPLGIVQFWSDLRSEGRTAVAEIAGALAFAGLASMIALASGGEIVAAGLVWLLLAARAAPAILYVRARLRLEKGQPADSRISTTAHAAALIFVLALALTGVVSPLLILGAAVLLVRAALGLSARRKPLAAKVIGFREIAYGAFYAVLVGVGV